jgi:hypothetical protein
MQGIYTYIPETNHVPKEYNVAAILSLLFMVPMFIIIISSSSSSSSSSIMSCRSLLAVKIRNDSKYFGIVMDQIAEENMCI